MFQVQWPIYNPFHTIVFTPLLVRTTYENRLWELGIRVWHLCQILRIAAVACFLSSVALRRGGFALCFSSIALYFTSLVERAWIRAAGANRRYRDRSGAMELRVGCMAVLLQKSMIYVWVDLQQQQRIVCASYCVVIQARVWWIWWIKICAYSLCREDKMAMIRL